MPGRTIAFLLLMLSHAAFARSSPPPPVAAPDGCAASVAAAETQYHLPAQLLGTIALVESGRADPATGRNRPWPWTINARGIDHFFSNKSDAVAAVQALQADGVRSIDVGCMQINLMYHPNAFASLDEAFDPAANANYGAHFLSALYHQIGNWPQAAAAYHSQTPDIGQGYQQRVMALWPLASKYPGAILAGHGVPADSVDYSQYTPAFAAALRQMNADQARLLDRFKPADSTGGNDSQYTPEFAARVRQMRGDIARLNEAHGTPAPATPTPAARRAHVLLTANR